MPLSSFTGREGLFVFTGILNRQDAKGAKRDREEYGRVGVWEYEK